MDLFNGFFHKFTYMKTFFEHTFNIFWFAYYLNI